MLQSARACAAALFVACCDAPPPAPAPVAAAPPPVAACSPDAAQAPAAAAVPASADLLLGPGFWNDWQCEEPHKNVITHMPLFAPATNAPGVDPLVEAERVRLRKTEAGEFDPRTGRITLKPGERYVVGNVFECRAGNPRDNGEWSIVSRATGDARASAFGFSETPAGCPGAQRLARQVDAQTAGTLIEIDGGARGGDIYLDFAGPAKWESDPFGVRPRFASNASVYGVIRPMDWFGVNGAKIVDADDWIEDGSFLKRAPLNAPSAHPSWRGGLEFREAFRTANAAHAALWVTLPATLGAEPVLPQLLAFDGQFGNRGPFVAAVRANARTIVTAARGEYRDLCLRLAQSARASGYADATRLIIEVGNEPWNSAGIFGVTFNYFGGLTQGYGYFEADNMGYGQGLIHAAMVDGCESAFAQAKPAQQRIYALSVQTAAMNRSGVGRWFGIAAARAMADYYLANGIDARRLTMIATTGYFYGYFDFQCDGPLSACNPAANPFGALNRSAFDAALKAAYAADPAAARRRQRDWLLGPAAGLNVTAIVAQNANAVDFASQYGFQGVGQYEGSSHSVSSHAAEWSNWIVSPEAREVQAEMIRRLRALGVNPIANYMDIARATAPGAPWVERGADAEAAPRGAAAAWSDSGRTPIAP